MMSLRQLSHREEAYACPRDAVLHLRRTVEAVKDPLASFNLNCRSEVVHGGDPLGMAAARCNLERRCGPDWVQDEQASGCHSRESSALVPRGALNRPALRGGLR